MKPYYKDDAVTIYHADCREILPQLEPVDLVLTDPPYGINFAAQPTKWQRLNGQMAEMWDVKLENETVLSVINKGQEAIIWGGNYYCLPISRGWLAWIKPDAPPSMSTVELAWTTYDSNARYIKHSISATNGERLGHPTQKPLAVIRWSLLCDNYALTILDPFMGSGTTLRAAKDLGRKAIGIEIEEKYCEIAAKRMAQEVFQFSNEKRGGNAVTN